MERRPRIILRQAAAYAYEALWPVVFELMDEFLRDRNLQSARIVIKPNLLAPAPPERAIVTHPLVVRAAVEYCLGRGGRVQVSDSQALGRFSRVAGESGLTAALQGLDVRCVEFRESVEVDVGEPFKKIEVARDAVEADLLINLPKLKTHTQMLMTLGVKNLFGCIVGLKKPEWHLRTGVNRDLFATLLVKLCGVLRPALTLLDGVLAMEGQGPGRSGIPRQVGVLAASNDAFALDSAVCSGLGVEPGRVLTNRMAWELGFLAADAAVSGQMPGVEGFRLPEITPLIFGPKPLHGFMRRHLVQRPVPADTCRLCGECWKYCPVKAISKGRRRVSIDYDKCIRCYCCIEVCPHGALRAGEPILGRVVRRVRR